MHHSSNKSSKHQFFLQLLTIYYQQDRLDDMTRIIRKALEKVDYVQITDLMDIYEIVSVTYFTDLEKARVFASNWKSALNNLEPSTKNLFLYDMKLVYEERMANHKDLGDPLLFEGYRFELREDPEETALQARCIKCDIVQNLSYMTSDLTIRSLNDKPLTYQMSECGDVTAWLFPFLGVPLIRYDRRQYSPLGIIFARTKNRERFTDESLLYQKILSFSLLGTAHQSFARWKICKWLKDNHRPSKNGRLIVYNDWQEEKLRS